MKQPKVGDRKVFVVERGKGSEFKSLYAHINECSLDIGCVYLKCKSYEEIIEEGALIAVECYSTEDDISYWRRISDD